MPPIPLFVYGTLRDPEVRALVLGRSIAPDKLRKASAPGYRVVRFPGRSYPALVAAEGESAGGLLLEDLSAVDIAALDVFEGREYSRGEIELIVNGAVERAGVYWPALPVGPSEVWQFEDWARDHKRAFLAAEAESVVKGRKRPSGMPPR